MLLLAADGANLAQGTLVGTNNLTLHSLFRSVDVEVFGTVISDSNHLYHYRSNMETLLNFPKDVLTTRYAIEGFLQDTAEATTMGDTSLAQGGTNLSLIAGANWFAHSAVVSFVGRPHLDIFHSEHAFPGGVDLKIRFHPVEAKFLTKCTPPTGTNPIPQYRYKITKMELVIKNLMMNPSLVNPHKKMWQKMPYQLGVTTVHRKTRTIPAKTSDYQQEILRP